jgi:hypothetical protein
MMKANIVKMPPVRVPGWMSDWIFRKMSNDFSMDSRLTRNNNINWTRVKSVGGLVGVL